MPFSPDHGYLSLTRFRGAPLRIHWTTPIGAFLLCGGTLGMAFAPVAWVAFVLLVIVHELGHAVLVWRYGLRVVSIDVHGLGGACRWVGQTSDLNRAKIAWGGIVAQALLLVATTVVAPVVPPNPLLGQVIQTWTAVNVLVMLFNLLPVRGLDGAEAWTLFRWRNMRGLARKTALEGKRRKLEEELARLEAEAHPGGGTSKRDDRSTLN